MQAFLIFCTFNVICAMIVILSDSYFIVGMIYNQFTINIIIYMIIL